MEAREVFKSGKTADELARERMLDDVALSNKSECNFSSNLKLLFIYLFYYSIFSSIHLINF